MSSESDQEKKANKIFYVCVAVVIVIVIAILCVNQFVFHKVVEGNETSQYLLDNIEGAEKLELVSISDKQEENVGSIAYRYYNICNFKGDDPDVGYYFAIFYSEDNDAQSVQAGVITTEEMKAENKETAKEIMKVFMKKYEADSAMIANLDKLETEGTIIPESSSVGVKYTGYSLDKVDEMTATSPESTKFYYDYYIKDQKIK